MLCLQQSNDGILCYRPAIEGVGSNIYYIGSKMGEFAYQAKVCMVCVRACVCVHACMCVCMCV